MEVHHAVETGDMKTDHHEGGMIELEAGTWTEGLQDRLMIKHGEINLNHVEVAVELDQVEEKFFVI